MEFLVESPTAPIDGIEYWDTSTEDQDAVIVALTASKKSGFHRITFMMILVTSLQVQQAFACIMYIFCDKRVLPR